jgi:nicotinate-nucleotide--dimethylbenzimidazole phosphoribosyltransferase
MGIGNTTTSSAIVAALLGHPAAEVTGKGAGLSNDGLAKKIQVIDQAIALHKPDPSDPIDVLSKVGGYDIAAMTGFYIGCARAGVPAVMDGFISTVAALLAVSLCPKAKDALIASHLSAEPGAGYVMEKLGLKPLLSLGMALGEGTGAVSAMPLIDMALREYFDMPSFDGLGMDAYQPL